MSIDDIVKTIGEDHLQSYEIVKKLKGKLSPETITQNIRNAHRKGIICREVIPTKRIFLYYLPKEE